MKIALVAPTPIPARRANTVQVMKMAQALTGLGHTVCLATPADSSRDRLDTERSSVSNEIPPAWEDLQRHYGLKLKFELKALAVHPQLRRYDYGWEALRWARRWGAQILYTRLPQAAALSSQSGFPTVLEIHDLPGGGLGPLLFRLFLHGKGAQRLVVITRALANDLAKQAGVRAGYRAILAPPFTLIAPDGVDLDRYVDLPAPREARLCLAKDVPLFQGGRLDAFTAGYTGHLYAGRGAELLLDLAGKLPGVNFLLVGGEPEEVRRIQQAAERSHLANLAVTGFIPNADLPCYQAACDVLLMPYQKRVAASSGGDISRYLSPMKLFEYLASGRAILSSDLPVLQEVLNERNALLLPADDAAAWAAALQALQSDANRRQRLADQARLDAAAYTWEARAHHIFDDLPRKS